MTFGPRLVRVLSVILYVFPISIGAQTGAFHGIPVMYPGKSTVLEEHFRDFRIYHMDLQGMSDYVQSEEFRNAVDIVLPGYEDLSLELYHNKVVTENYQVKVQTESGASRYPGDGVIKTFMGTRQKGQYDVRLTIDNDFLYGYLQVKEDLIMIEPLRHYLPSATRDQIIVYRQSDFLDPEHHTCGSKHFTPGQMDVPKGKSKDQTRSVGECREVEIALANDWLMYEDHNESVSDVENLNIAVMNAVQGNYDDEFADELQYMIVEIYISTCSTCDPWTSSTDPNTLLDSFRDWAPSGFSNTNDVATLWTDRDFNGQTVGLAWLEGVCFTNWKYSTCQDFTSNLASLRVLLAHELGHNFGSSHDPNGSQTIMAPSIVLTNTWSAQSINAINNFIAGIGCLTECVGAIPPIANFEASPVEGCEPFMVQFDDLSTNNPESWEWTFPGGMPSSSTEENPQVTYSIPGIYDVILEVSNAAGSDIIAVSDFITVNPFPVPDFSYMQLGLEVVFDNLSEHSDFYFWEFGDGETSTQDSPVHIYDQDGIYEVSLTATNECGSESLAITIEIVTPPEANFSYAPGEGCEPLTVSFINQSSSNSETFFWSFPGGVPATSTLTNPQVVYEEPGTYSVSLVVENIVGQDELILTDIITVDPLPTAEFGYTVNGALVDFQNSSLNATSYIWEFGDGGTSSLSSPSYTYEEGGVYLVTLTSANNCGIAVATLQVSVQTAPVASFTSSQNSGCAPLQILFSSTSQGEVDSYDWSFPGGSPSSSNEPEVLVSYATAGTYAVELIVSNASGSDTVSSTSAVVVGEGVNSEFAFDIDGASVDFLNLSSGASEFIWLIDGQIIAEQHPSYTFSVDGDYLVALIVSGSCGTDTSEQTVHIATLPVADFEAQLTVGCEPFVVQFENMSTSNATIFEWSFPGGQPATSNEPEPLVTYNEAGTYSVSLAVWSEVGSDMIEFVDYITVDPQPLAAFETVQNGTQVQFENMSEDAASYTWIFGDGLQSDEPDPLHDYTIFGTYEVLLIATNNCGTDTASLIVELAEIPVPKFMAASTSGCIPYEVQFFDESQNGAEEWSWTFPGGNPPTSLLKNPVIVYQQTGVYSVSLTVSNSAGSQTLVKDEYITVEEPPTALFTLEVDEATVELENLSEGGSTYVWMFGDGVQDTAIHTSHTYAETGQYTITLIALNACGSDSTTTNVDIKVTSREDLTTAGQQIDVWPNPTSGTFYIGVVNGMENVHLQVVDMLGRIVWVDEDVKTISGQPLQVSLEDVASGLYHVILRHNGTSHVYRLVMQPE